MTTCTHCQREFETDDQTHPTVPFCGTYCEQSWWMSPTAARDYDKLINAS